MDGGDAAAPWTPIEISEGEWAGWRIWSSDPYELLSGPFYYRRDEDGRAVCAFRAEVKHMNGGGFMHGGCLLTFADYALFCIAAGELKDSGSVTASLNAEFIDAARAGDRIEATGEVIRAGGALVFIRGLVATDGRPLLNFSAIVKKVRRR
ncbi:MAG TPA: PaaI family thioesterase [Caulobacteraceae bacterium]|nr:PaaI family thioesterase [Caulobacteraceae bacterium]